MKLGFSRSNIGRRSSLAHKSRESREHGSSSRIVLR
jgi:hypothetical protein